MDIYSQRSTDAKPVALVISGSGRSGSTILSILLSQNPDTLNLGQSRDFWKAYAENQPCTCGCKIKACALWSEVARLGFPDWKDADFLQVSGQMRAFLKDAATHDDWANEVTIRTLRTRHIDFLTAYERFLKACLDLSGARVLVDSSKSPEIALAILLTDVLEVAVVNLMRDPRAVACSWTKKNLEPKQLNRQLTVWRERQIRLGGWKSGRGLRIRSLDYEAFVRKPQSIIAAVLRWIGADSSTENFTAPKRLDLCWQRQHLFPPANEKVLAERRQDVEIRSPNSWRNPAYWRLHWRAVRSTYPQGLSYIVGTKWLRRGERNWIS